MTDREQRLANIRNDFNRMKVSSPNENTCYPIFYSELDFLLSEIYRLQQQLEQSDNLVLKMLASEKGKADLSQQMQEFDDRYRHSEFDYTKLQQERDKAIEGLRWYAEERRYIPFDELGMVEYVPKDSGTRARSILSDLGVSL